MMYRANTLLLLVAVVALTTGGCASSQSVQVAQAAANISSMSAKSPVTGSVYTDAKGPVAATSHAMAEEAPRTGRATAKSVLGLVGVGDASIEAAMDDGDITEVWYINYEVKNYLGIYATFTTVAYGE